ncbi:MAG: hypothetical protein MRK01_06230 [Candidatus Scalindua sp.]|nr:hypothetical protein [Candidatus Scalindua sp.]
MGSKQTWGGKCVFFFLTCLVMLLFWIQGCANFPGKRSYEDSSVDPEISTNGTHEESINEKSIQETELNNMFPQFARKWQGMQKLAKARVLMLNGYYNSSLKRNKEVLRLFPRTLGDQALFQMGLNYAYPGNLNRNYKKSKKCFQRVLKEYPESDIRDQAGIWVLFLRELMAKDSEINNLQNQIEGLQYKAEDLQDQIERLKEIDLRTEEKKRESLSK